MKPCYLSSSADYPDDPGNDCTGIYASKSKVDLFAASLVGGPVTPSQERVRFAFHRAKLRIIGQLDYLANADRTLLVSDRLADIVVELAREDIQTLPAVIQCEDGVTTDFQVLHLLHLRRCIDRVRSIPEMVPGLNFPVNYTKLVLHENCMDGAMFARDAGYSSLVLIDRSIVEALRALPFTGFAIKEDQEYDGAQ